MKDTRERTFFWLGVFVLPLFWSWFTLSMKFARRERFVAFLWLAVFVLWLLHQRSAVVDQLETLSFVYPAILGWVTVALYAWLLFRIDFSGTFIAIFIIGILVSWDILAGLASLWFVDRLGHPFDWKWLLPAFLAALAHLAVEPLGRCTKSREVA